MNLLDPRCEPTDSELAALTRDMQRIVIRKRDEAQRVWQSELARRIRDATRGALAPDSDSLAPTRDHGD